MLMASFFEDERGFSEWGNMKKEREKLILLDYLRITASETWVNVCAYFSYNNISKREKFIAKRRKMPPNIQHILERNGEEMPMINYVL